MHICVDMLVMPSAYAMGLTCALGGRKSAV